ncbi:Ig-like domain-containing protein [Microbacterium sp. CJ88]|uniref:Ig-like domain-containing protein n=1 Tax=Microbacterium sp. CJ88 TaxID=3445672 RepID=UPI003F65578C
MRRTTIAGLVAAAAATALVVGVSIVWPGLDARETPVVDTSVWALQTGDGRRYARVNTAIGELDTVRSVSNPSQIVAGGGSAYLLTDSNSRLTRIDAALPSDLDDQTVRASPATPPGTTDVVSAGDFVAYRTDAGAVFAGRLSSGSTVQLDPFRAPGDDTAPQYRADAIAVDDRGILFAYSSDDGSVLRYDIAAATVRGRDPLDATGITAPAITAAGDDWAVVDTATGDVRLRRVAQPVQTAVRGAIVVGEPDASGDAVYLADDSTLVHVPVDGSAPRAELEGTALGTPAHPVVHGGEVLAAWLPQGNGGGTLWSSRSGRHPLDFGGRALADQRRPVFVETADAVILNETRTGWVWTAPEGRLVASSQDWTLDDRTNPQTQPSDQQLSVVIDPKPPVAEPDAFGVRAGALVSLPVLLNDHDPNQDVLSIDPQSVTGLDPGFGTVSLTDSAQRLAVRVAPGATGSTTFSYAVTDGTAPGGLRSDPTTVTLTVAAPDAAGAPQWCGVDKCLQKWPAPEVARGGTVTVPVLQGWVDPEGDPLLLLAVRNESGVGSVAATPGGDVVYQHSDSGAGADESIDLTVVVADTTGQQSTKTLTVKVSGQPALAVQSFAVVDSVEAGLTIDVAPHVTGTTGMLSLTGVRVLDDAAATATVVGGTTTFDFSARDPGTFRVGFTVSDGTTDATGTARVTLVAATAPADLATSPVVAFVHPQEDATLDVFGAVSNPTRRVLLLSDVIAHPDPGASMTVDDVGQHDLRISGSTESGSSGRLGTVTYTVSDGTDDAGARVQGVASVYLLPPAPQLAPIAVDDAVVVRAGAQIDIPVLANDVAPSGGRPILDPASITSSTPNALAFASGELLRYLAPAEPGDYAVDYSVSTTGAPALADTATVRIKVLADDSNRAPVPNRLEGRVLAGLTTDIPFTPFGADPDGDVVRLDRIVTQPDSGAATLSADGSSIVYSSVAGYKGQVSFRYRVVDAFGQTGEATVRIGVLDGESDPSPVTYTDYVQVQAGAGNTIRVSPLANDVDPTRGRLRLTGVRPDVPQVLSDGSQSTAYAQLAARIGAVSDTTVTIEAGTEPTTMSFLYDVESASGNTGRGLIVVKVVRESVPDYPVVTDTVLTAQNREDFVRGVDVVSGHATWSGGDVGALRVALWGQPDGVTVEGTKLRGALPATTRIIPVAITGDGRNGPVTTYAFLRVPGDDDLALTLRSGLPAVKATELSSATFDMAALVAMPRGRVLEVGDDVRSSGARPTSSCARDSGTSIRYTAGPEAPWADACRVPVRLQGQPDWTYLSVPITVVPLNPQPVLRPASITVGPGETSTFDLRSMTTWQLREDWADIRYALEHTGSMFTVALSGSQVTVTGADRAVPGTEEAAIVSVPSHTGVTPTRLILRVGAAPSTLPQGGSTAQQCSQATGSSCVITVVGAPGEVNPLPRTPLELTAVAAAGACVGVSFEVASRTQVRASWTADAPGATCPATFTLRDAQGRPTGATRDGRLLLDLQGFPKAPASIVQTSYSDGSLTVRVDPGEARLAYPALTGFTVRSQGAVVAQCAADGTCPAISAPNGEKREYVATAVNAVGESPTAVRTTAWAYIAPPRPVGITAAPVVTRDGVGGVVSLSIPVADPAGTGSFQIASPAGDTVRVNVAPGQARVDVPSFRVGSNAQTVVSITPYSRFDLPPGLGGGQATGQIATIQTNGIGAPQNVNLVLTSRSNGDGTSTVDASATAQPNGTGSELRYAIVPSAERARCNPVAGGNTATFPPVADGQEYAYFVCVESWFDGQSFGRATAEGTVRAEQSAAAPTGYTFTVGRAPTVDQQTNLRAEWRIAQINAGSAPPRLNDAKYDGWGPGTTVFDRDPQIKVYFQHRLWGTQSARAAVDHAPGSAPYQVQATWLVSTCQGGAPIAATGSSSNGDAAITFDYTQAVYRDVNGTVIPTADPSIVPPDASSVRGVRVTVDWSAKGWGLDPAAATFDGTCTPVPPPAPPTP